VIDSADIENLGLPRTIHGAQELSAVPLSGGVVVGTARVVRSPDDVHQLGSDTILV
jgi:hypothetical protein